MEKGKIIHIPFFPTNKIGIRASISVHWPASSMITCVNEKFILADATSEYKAKFDPTINR